MREPIGKKGPGERLFNEFYWRLIAAAQCNEPPFNIKAGPDKVAFDTLNELFQGRYGRLSPAQQEAIAKEKADWEEALQMFDRYHDDPEYFRRTWHGKAFSWSHAIDRAKNEPEQKAPGGLLAKLLALFS